MDPLRELWHIETLRLEWMIHHPFWSIGLPVGGFVFGVVVLYALESL